MYDNNKHIMFPKEVTYEYFSKFRELGTLFSPRR